MDHDIRILNTVRMDDSKYAMMNNGMNPEAPSVVAAIGVNMFDVLRFRDAGYDKHLKRIWILTRTGSTNHFRASNDGLKTNPLFEICEDDEVDDTYELYFFHPPHKNFKHVPVPNFKRLLHESAKRFKTGELNEYEREFTEQLRGILGGD